MNTKALTQSRSNRLAKIISEANSILSSKMRLQRFTYLGIEMNKNWDEREEVQIWIVIVIIIKEYTSKDQANDIQKHNQVYTKMRCGSWIKASKKK